MGSRSSSVRANMCMAHHFCSMMCRYAEQPEVEPKSIYYMGVTTQEQFEEHLSKKAPGSVRSRDGSPVSRSRGRGATRGRDASKGSYQHNFARRGGATAVGAGFSSPATGAAAASSTDAEPNRRLPSVHFTLGGRTAADLRSPHASRTSNGTANSDLGSKPSKIPFPSPSRSSPAKDQDQRAAFGQAVNNSPSRIPVPAATGVGSVVPSEAHLLEARRRKMEEELQGLDAEIEAEQRHQASNAAPGARKTSGTTRAVT